MQKAEMKIVRFDKEDVVATSGTPPMVTLSNYFNSNNNDNQIFFMEKTYNTSDAPSLNDLKAEFLKFIDNADPVFGFRDTTGFHADLPLSLFIDATEDGDHVDSTDNTVNYYPDFYNGVFIWDSTLEDGAGAFVKKSN